MESRAQRLARLKNTHVRFLLPEESGSLGELRQYIKSLPTNLQQILLNTNNFNQNFKHYRDYNKIGTTNDHLWKLVIDTGDYGLISRLINLGMDFYPIISESENSAVFISDITLRDNGIISNDNFNDQAFHEVFPKGPNYFYGNPLEYLAENRRPDILKLILGKDSDLARLGSSALSIAIKNNDMETIDILLQHGTDVNFSPHHKIPLPIEVLLSSADYSTAVFNKLVSFGLNPNRAVIFSVKNPQQLEDLLAVFPQQLNLVNQKGETFMMVVVRNGSYDLDSAFAEILAKYQADDSVRDNNGLTVYDLLSFTRGSAAIMKAEIMVQLLIETGFNPQGKQHPITLWKNYVHRGITTDLPDPNMIFDPIPFRVPLPAFNIPFESNGQFSDVIPLPRTALGYAAYIYDFDMIKVLVENGAERINTLGSDYDDPLGLAARRGKLDIVKYLIGSKYNLGKVGTTALTLAILAENNREEIITFLLERGADPNYPLVRYPAPLQMLLLNNYSDTIFNLLLAGGALLNVKYNGTPVIFSCRNAHQLETFVGAGGDINIQDDNGNNFLAVTLLRRNRGREKGEWEQLMKVLIDMGADFANFNNDGYSPLMLRQELFDKMEDVASKADVYNLFE